MEDEGTHLGTVGGVGSAVGAQLVLLRVCFRSWISGLTWYATHLGREQDFTYPTGLTPTDSRALLATHFK